MPSSKSSDVSPWYDTPVSVEEKVCETHHEWVLPDSTPHPKQEVHSSTGEITPPPPPSEAEPTYKPFTEPPSTIHSSESPLEDSDVPPVSPPSPPPSAGSDSAILADAEHQEMVTGLKVVNSDPQPNVREEVGPNHAQEDLIPFPAQAGSDDGAASSQGSGDGVPEPIDIDIDW